MVTYEKHEEGPSSDFLIRYVRTYYEGVHISSKRYGPFVEREMKSLLPSDASFDQVSAWFNDHAAYYVSGKAQIPGSPEALHEIVRYWSSSALKWAYNTTPDKLKKAMENQKKMHLKAKKRVDGYEVVDYINKFGKLDLAKIRKAIKEAQKLKATPQKRKTKRNDGNQKRQKN